MIREVIEVLLIFLRLGLTSFGGPIAHLSYFHDEFVRKRKWFDEHAYADLVALCQFLPGPASSQVGIAIGLSRAGLLGAIAAWIGFTLPSALLLIAFAFGVSALQGSTAGGWLHGLKIVAVAIVAQALWGMGVRLCPDRKRASIAALAAVGASLLPTALGQVGVILLGAVLGLFFVRGLPDLPHSPLKLRIGSFGGAVSLTLFVFLLIALPLLVSSTGFNELKLFDSFFRTGSLVFGGGHVVLPLLKAEVVNPSWVSADTFMAGYGAAQAVPGPLFSFSAYLGASARIVPSRIEGALICLTGAFLPSFLLIIGALPFWERLRKAKQMRYAMLGINAAVVGLLLAAFYNPVWISAIFSPKDFALTIACILLLVFWKVPSWGVVLFGALVGGLWL